MQQERERGVEEVRQNQDRRLKTMQMENQQHQQQQPQKCPRCDSLNTKFCYYNNYSLSQPRYFCKTCRRYWTQGGTLRNVPVGGGCRKGKRTKTSSSGENSSSHPPPQQPQQTHQNLTSSAVISTTNEPTNLASPAIQSISSLYPGGGFLSSLAAIQSLNQPQAFNQNLSVGTDLGASSNLGLLQGFNVPPFGSQQHQQIQQTEFYQMENRDKNSETLYPSEEGLIQSSRVPSSQHDWHQSFGNNSNIPTVSHAILWSTNGSTTTSTAGNNNRNTAGSSLNPYQWPDLPGYGPTL